MYPISPYPIVAFNKGNIPKWKEFREEEPNVKYGRYLLIRTMNRLIKAWTRGPYVHQEVIIPASDEIGEEYHNKSFSASGYENSVRFKDIDYSHEERWCFVQVRSRLNLQLMVNKMLSVAWLKYDYWGAIWCVTKRKAIDVSYRWYCSEVGRMVLGMPGRWQRSPSYNFNELIRDGGVIMRGYKENLWEDG